MEIPCLEKFDFNAKKLPTWKQQFLRFRSASDLANKHKAQQGNSAILPGRASRRHICQLQPQQSRFKEIYVVIKCFNQFFIVKKNVIFERAQFNRRKQMPSKTTNDFITALFKLSETCEYGKLHDQLIRDRLMMESQMPSFPKNYKWTRISRSKRPLQLLSRRNKYEVNQTSYVTPQRHNRLACYSLQTSQYTFNGKLQETRSQAERTKTALTCLGHRLQMVRLYAISQMHRLPCKRRHLPPMQQIRTLSKHMQVIHQQTFTPQYR